MAKSKIFNITKEEIIKMIEEVLTRRELANDVHDAIKAQVEAEFALKRTQLDVTIAKRMITEYTKTK